MPDALTEYKPPILSKSNLDDVEINENDFREYEHLINV